MAQATHDPIITGPVRFSSLFADPLVRDAFRRAERDAGHVFAVSESPLLLAGGAVEPLPALGERVGIGPAAT
jgi:hypothetical protein